MAKTLVFSTDPALVGELVGAAKAAGGDVVGTDASAVEGQPAEVAVAALHEAAQRTGATRVFIAGNRRGKEIAPRLAARLDAAYVASAIGLSSEGGALLFRRKFMGGRTVATEKVAGGTVVATLAPHAFEPVADAVPSESLKADPSVTKVKVVERRARETGAVNIEEAPVIVAFGRGVKKKEDMQPLFDLARALGGEVGCTRPISADLHWLGDERWIGLSGKNVKPKAYIALGVSGQIQHLAGCRDSGVIVVVNQDKNAPFFQHCDYGIVGDLYKLVPALMKRLK